MDDDNESRKGAQMKGLIGLMSKYLKNKKRFYIVASRRFEFLLLLMMKN